MPFSLSSLWSAPPVNPINKKARSIPVFNPVNKYGRVFFFSWFGFLLAFWSWYAFPPLLHDVIAKDLKLSTVQVQNSNIIALVATLLVRLVAGPACDRFGPRWTFAGCLLVGAIPTFLSGTAYNVHQLYALRFFIGILGGSFVPCQVWTTGFYDKNIIGTANSLTAGLGNAGGGITYFVMPAVYNALVGDGLTPHTAWRVTFIVPGILITTVAIALLLLCQDTPTGKWSERHQAAENNLRSHSVDGRVVEIPGHIADEGKRSGTSSPPSGMIENEKKLDHEAQLGDVPMLETAQGEIVQKPSFRDIAKVCFSPQTIVVGACYFCGFGAELAINSILGTYYGVNFKGHVKNLGLQTASNWAAMFGLMNALFRPLGGAVSDLVYKHTKSVWAKKALLHSYGIIAGAFLLAIGLTNPHNLATLVCLIGIGFAFFLEGGNGLIFSLVPHVHPHANGVVSGFTGASGNLGGIIFSIIFRYNVDTVKGVAVVNYARSIWIIGVIMIGINVAVCWIKPIPKGQIAGR
ncbi:nitrate transporter [Lecanosticta acicola]|uniref:Nitrate/nitrite transporter n=1 Tax=Lecanosticta acicola TaxID=111012 RepID=A0AAI9EF93_9PEZI|nr:nitrate transporter [Lecanosticta acicola]